MIREHKTSNRECPWNDAATMAEPGSSRIPCLCPEKELRSCPFCRVDELTLKSWDEGGHTLRQVTRWYVECWNCEATGPSGDTEEQAKQQWNDRGNG